MKIYKFMSLHRDCCEDTRYNEYTEECIRLQKVFFNDWKKLNDPMEGFYSYYPHEHDKNIEQILNGEKQQYKIFCCSKEYKSILMWSYYADSHKGICLEIEVDEDLCNQSDIFHRNVVYKKNLVEISPKLNTRDQAKHILKYKLSKWRYEQEVRFFKENDIPNSFKIGQIKSILLGSRCEDKDIEIIKEWNGNISLKRISFDENSNTMEIK